MPNNASKHQGTWAGILQISRDYATYKHHLKAHDTQPHICRAEGGPGNDGNKRYANMREDTSIHAGAVRRVLVPYVEHRLGYARGFGGGGYDRKAAVIRMLSTYPDNDGFNVRALRESSLGGGLLNG